jgi:hypothetical protein
MPEMVVGVRMPAARIFRPADRLRILLLDYQCLSMGARRRITLIHVKLMPGGRSPGPTTDIGEHLMLQ